MIVYTCSDYILYDCEYLLWLYTVWMWIPAQFVYLITVNTCSECEIYECGYLLWLCTICLWIPALIVYYMNVNIYSGCVYMILNTCSDGVLCECEYLLWLYSILYFSCFKRQTIRHHLTGAPPVSVYSILYCIRQNLKRQFEVLKSKN